MTETFRDDIDTFDAEFPPNRTLYNKDIAQQIHITSDSTSTAAMNTKWSIITSSIPHNNRTFSGHFEGHVDDLLQLINSTSSSTVNIEYKLSDDTTITMSNVTIQPNDVSNGEGEYMIFPVKGQGITIKPPEMIETLDDQLKAVPE